MPLSDQLHAAFDALYKDAELRKALHSRDYVQGLVFAVASSPEIPMPDQWMPWALSMRGQLASQVQADQVGDGLMGLLQQQLAQMRMEQTTLPSHLVLPEDLTLISAQQTALSAWCNGVVAGHQALQDVWQQAWDRMQTKNADASIEAAKRLRHCLNMFTTFADVPLALARSASAKTLAEKLPEVFKSLPKAVADYVALAGELADFLPQQFESFVQAESPAGE